MPENFSGEPIYSGNDIVALLLTWDLIADPRNSHYSLHRDTVENFTPDSNNFIAEIPDTFYFDLDWRWMPHYVYKLCSNDTNSVKSEYASLDYDDIYTGDIIPQVPKAFALHQNVPNPFNPTTTIRFDLPLKDHVRLCVYNVKGELLSIIVDQFMTEGRKEVAWNGKDNKGHEVSSGIYFCHLVVGDFVQTKKMVLLR